MQKTQIATPRALQKLSMQLHTLPTIMLAVVGCDVNYNSYKNAYLTEEAYRIVASRSTSRLVQGLLYLDGRNSQKYLHQDQAYF